jgi:NADPH-dependent 2,4-dienoyl-CoA reductase/sulfur reductase-like enzyme
MAWYLEVGTLEGGKPLGRSPRKSGESLFEHGIHQPHHSHHYQFIALQKQRNVNMTDNPQTDVLIIGGGPVGLLIGYSLARQGVGTIVVGLCLLGILKTKAKV